MILLEASTIDLTSGDESDGMTAARKVAAAAAVPVKPRRGPVNKTLVHWDTPKAIVDEEGNDRWLFKCKYCDRYALIVCQ